MEFGSVVRRIWRMKLKGGEIPGKEERKKEERMTEQTLCGGLQLTGLNETATFGPYST